LSALCPNHPAEHRNGQAPRVSLLNVGVTSTEEACNRLLGEHYPSLVAPTDSFANPAISPRLRPGLVRGVFAGCYQPLLLAGPSRRYSANLSLDARALTTAVPLGAFAWFFPSVIGLPSTVKRVGFPLLSANATLHGYLYGAAAISLCSGLQVCLPPRSLLPLQIFLQGSRGVFVQAERASLPWHALDKLAARLQAIGGARTFASQDSQPCRLLLTARYFSSCPSDSTSRWTPCPPKYCKQWL